MTDKEYNEKVPTIVASIEVGRSIDRASIREYTGEWDMLLETRESDKETCDILFSLLKDKDVHLTEENRTRILDLKKGAYPLLLCDLAKCYDVKDRFQDERRVLQEARSLGSKGADVLLFSLYKDHANEGESEMNLFGQAFKRVKNIDFFSENVTDEINNERFQYHALLGLVTAYLVFEDNANKAHECLVRALETDWPDDFKERIKGLLSHFRQNLFGGYRYVK